MATPSDPRLAQRESPLSRPTGRIGNYRLLDLIGEGGMGEVWLAEQMEPVRRRVAVKIVKLGMDTRDVIARFEAERQMLAIVDHPNIAAVYDGGVTETGRPYFVMELVRGVPITDYCDTQRLPTRERLRMFQEVCHAVQHAHQKGIIHRDLKPTNILVTVAAGQPAVKVIDFGVGKAVGGQRLTEKTLHTQIGQTLGTPAYMSPEQAEGFGSDVDTRSDIYSLGVVLYELLVGTLPFDPQPGAALEFAIREHDVARPSTRFRTLDVRETVAKLRATTPKALARQLRGDLDWIILCATEKDRTRRYASADALALDIERHLRHEPILARPPSGAYRFRRFVRRHRSAVAAGAVAMLSLLFAAGASVAGLIRARASEARAREEAAAASQVSDFLVSLFSVSDPGQALGSSVTAREILDRGSLEIRSRLHEQPQVRSRLLGTMGGVYASLGLYDSAEGLLREALALASRDPSATEATPPLLSSLAWVLQRRGKIAEADSMLLDGIRRLSGHPEMDTLRADLMVSLVGTRSLLGRVAEADSLLREALVIQERVWGPKHRRVAATLAALAFVHDDDPATSEPLLRRAHAIELAERGPDHPVVLGLANNLGLMLKGDGRFDEAATLLADVVARRERVLGPRHALVGQTLMNLSLTHLARGRPEEALPAARRAVTLVSAGGAADSGYLGLALQFNARAHLALGATDSAHVMFVRALTLLARSRGPTHNWTAQARTGLGQTYAAMGRHQEAERALRQALDAQTKNWGPAHRTLLEPMQLLGDLLVKEQRFAEAESVYRRAIAVSDVAVNATHPHRRQVFSAYVHALRLQGRTTEADSVQRGASVTRQDR